MTGRTLIGVAYPDTGLFKNFMMHMRSFTASDPSILDTNGYPVSSPASNVSGTIFMASNLAQSEILVIKGTGKCDIQIARGSPGFTVVSDANSVVNGSAGFNLRVTNTNSVLSWRVTFQFTTSVPASVTFNFLAGGSFDGSLAGLVLCRASDENAISVATTPEELWSDDYINIHKALNPKVVRPMGFVNPNSGNVSQSRYLPNWQTSLNISSQRWEPRAWAGSTSGTNAYACSAQPDATGVYVDGEMIQLKFVNASTSTPITLNSGGRGDIPLLNAAGSALSASTIKANTLATVTYDAVLGAFLYQTSSSDAGLSQGGQSAAMPYELQIAFANRIGCDFWCVFPSYFDDTSVTAISVLVGAKLNEGRNGYFEYGNEIWNFGFPATTWATAKGAALGFPSDNARQLFGWYGLRARKTMELVTDAWSPRSLTQLKRVLAFQAFGAKNATDTYRLQGSDLASVANGGQGNSTFVNVLGNPNYKTVGQRPIDFADVLSYATYYSGAQLTNFDAQYTLAKSSDAKSVTGGNNINPVQLTITGHGYSTGQRLLFNASGGFTGTGWSTLNGQSQTLTKIDANTISVPVDGSGFPAYSGNAGKVTRYANEMAGLTGAADNYASSNPTLMASALAWLDNDIRNGTNYGVIGGGTGDQTTTQLATGANGTGIYPQWDTLAVAYGKIVECYEGAFEGWYPSTTSCATLGISTSYGGATGTIAALLHAYKQSDLFRKLVQDQITQFMASSKSTTPAWLLVAGSSQWSLTQGADAFTSTFKSWDEIVLYNENKRRLVW